MFGDKVQLWLWSQKPEGKCCELIGQDIKDTQTLGVGVSAGMRREDIKLRDAFNKALGEMISDGTYKKLNEKYFPFPLNYCHPERSEASMSRPARSARYARDDEAERLERILDQADVMQHRGVRAGGVAGQDRAHDGVVLLVGALAAGPPPGTGRGGTGRPGGAGPSRSRRAARCARRHRSPNGRRRWRRNRPRVAASASAIIASCRACRRRRSIGVMLMRAQPRAGRLHLGHRDEQALDLLGRRLRHHRALARPHVDQAARRELAQRLAHRRARHAVLLRPGPPRRAARRASGCRRGCRRRSPSRAFRPGSGSRRCMHHLAYKMGANTQCLLMLKKNAMLTNCIQSEAQLAETLDFQG